MIALLTAAAETTEEAHRELPIPAEAFGILAFATLMALLFVTYAFRSVGTRH